MINSETSSKEEAMTRQPHSLQMFKRLFLRLLEVYPEDQVEAIFWLMAQTIGGENVTILSMDVLERETRNASIREGYDSGRYTRAELAGRFGLSVRHVNNLLSAPPLFSGESEDLK